MMKCSDLVGEPLQSRGVQLLNARFAAPIARAKASLEIVAIGGIQLQQRPRRRQCHLLPAMQTPPGHGCFEQQDRAEGRQKHEEHLAGTERTQIQERARQESGKSDADDTHQRHSELAAMSPGAAENLAEVGQRCSR